MSYSPVADTRVELLEFPETHDVIPVLVEHVKHAERLVVAETKLSLQHFHGLSSLQSTHVVLDVSVKYLLHLLAACAHHNIHRYSICI